LSTCNSKILQNSWFELIVRWIMGIIFLFSCYHKIVAPAQFAKIIYGYYLFPDVTISLIAIILPFLELFAGLFLVLGIYPRSAVLIINAMLFAFMVAISINLATGHEFDCGCFSFGDSNAENGVLTREKVFREIFREKELPHSFNLELTLFRYIFPVNSHLKPPELPLIFFAIRTAW